jgi:hypothetical protein
MEQEQPIVLELAEMPREQVGPYLLLGVAKDATAEQIEAHWAQRLIAARKPETKIPLEDINWAREILSTLDGRIRADAESLNVELAAGVLRQLADRYGLGERGPAWQLLDEEKALSDWLPVAEPPAAVPETPPEFPETVPADPMFFRELIEEPLDPWAVSISGHPQPEVSP